MEESKELFWESFSSGKVFAQRQSFWDALFVILGSRERDWLAMLLNLLIRVGWRGRHCWRARSAGTEAQIAKSAACHLSGLAIS